MGGCGGKEPGSGTRQANCPLYHLGLSPTTHVPVLGRDAAPVTVPLKGVQLGFYKRTTQSGTTQGQRAPDFSPSPYPLTEPASGMHGVLNRGSC